MRTTRLIPLLLGLVIAGAGCRRAPEPVMKPFEMDWRDNLGSPADVSFLLDAPAGRDGFITVRDGHLARPDGSRFRIWGLNASFAASFPDKESAPEYAAHLARFGVNCLRVHHGDRKAPRGLLDPKREDTRGLDPEMMDRLDFFVAELKKRGIYVNLNLNVSRPFSEADGVKDAALTGYGKGLTYFDPRLIELQREYARMLLTHKNPYTGNEYRHEPAVAIIEIVNENSILESWVGNRLQGKQTSPAERATWSDIPPSYEKDLTRLYNAWLRRKLSAGELADLRKEAGAGARDAIPRLQPADFAKASTFRFHTEASFYMELESKFFRMMGNFLKKDLGVRALVAGTSAHAGSVTPYPLLASTSLLDIVDGHTYWQHPAYRKDPATGESYSEFRNTPMVNEPLRSTVMTLARNAVAGKPYTVSEVNHPYPLEYACEGVPVLAAYAALHDWDGIFWYTFSHSAPAEWKPAAPGTFDFRLEPVKMTQLAAGALTFLRPDVGPAKETVARSYSRMQVIEGLRMGRGEAPFFTPGFPPGLALVHSLRIGNLDGEATAQPAAPAGDPIQSDTGEIAWHAPAEGGGVVTVDAPRGQALIGHLRANPRQTAHLAAEPANPFVAFTLNTLDGKPVAESSRMLLTTGAKVANEGMVWNEQRNRVLKPGGPPVLIETVVGSVTLRQLRGARDVLAQPLTSGGKPAGEPVRARRLGVDWRIELEPETAAPWYLVRVER